MAVRQLRSFIAPGAPATRRPCDGSEPDVRVEFGFTPRWYREACGVDFSQRWHLDALYRRETVVAMRRVLNERFPALQLGGPRPEESPATLDGVHGALVMALAFGIPSEYYADNWPAARHAYLSRKDVARLTPPQLEGVPAIAQIFEQMDTIEREFGRIEGYLNWQGVLNTAYRIRGPEVLADCLEDPPLARHLFEVVADTMIAGMRLIYARQEASGIRVRHATVSNCLVNMVSPEIYRDLLFPMDKKIGEVFGCLGVHNCAWNVDPYIADYAKLPNLAYVDMGLDSDLALARRLCPAARRAVMYKPTDLAGKSLGEIAADIERIRAELAPCDIVMADIDAGTPDERVIEFARLAYGEVPGQRGETPSRSGRVETPALLAFARRALVVGPMILLALVVVYLLKVVLGLDIVPGLHAWQVLMDWVRETLAPLGRS